MTLSPIGHPFINAHAEALNAEAADVVATATLRQVATGRVPPPFDFETISGHKEVMKHAKVSELKARLSAYLADVRRGETVVVSDRRTPVARLVPIDRRVEGLAIERARRPVVELRKVRAVRLRRRVDVLGMLRDSRDQR